MTRLSTTMTATCLLAFGTGLSVASAQEQDEQEAERAYVVLETSEGEIALELDRATAPLSVQNFLRYVNDGFYDGTVFHRVMPTFMIQGGGFDAELSKKTTRSPIVNEWRNGLKNTRGAIAMARLPNQPDSATSQFFINVVDNDFLDTPRDGAAYAVFGHVIGSREAMEMIRFTRTRNINPQMQNVPVEPKVIEHAEEVTDTDRIEALLEEDAKWRELAELARSDQQQAARQLLELLGHDANALEETESGMLYLDLEEGEGASPEPADRVTVHYTGFLVDGAVFDSSYARGQTATFRLNEVIAGWTEGVSGMSVGGVRMLVIPPELAYGARGRPGIPANAWLVFKVELTEIPS